MKFWDSFIFKRWLSKYLYIDHVYLAKKRRKLSANVDQRFMQWMKILCNEQMATKSDQLQQQVDNLKQQLTLYNFNRPAIHSLFFKKLKHSIHSIQMFKYRRKINAILITSIPNNIILIILIRK